MGEEHADVDEEQMDDWGRPPSLSERGSSFVCMVTTGGVLFKVFKVEV